MTKFARVHGFKRDAGVYKQACTLWINPQFVSAIEEIEKDTWYRIIMGTGETPGSFYTDKKGMERILVG